jgi:uncharacterized protein (DUF2141 family)
MARGNILTSLIGDKRSYPITSYFSLPPKKPPVFDEKSKILCDSLSSVHKALSAGKYDLATSTLASLIIEKEDDQPKVLALTSIRTAIKERRYVVATMELFDLLQREKAKPLPLEKPKVKTLAESINLVHNALNAGKYDLAIEILASLIDKVDDPLFCPPKYRSDGFDEQAIRSMESSMRSTRTAIEEKKYGDATVELITLYSHSMIQTQPAPPPRVFDKPLTINEIVEMLDEAHAHAKSKKSFHILWHKSYLLIHYRT